MPVSLPRGAEVRNIGNGAPRRLVYSIIQCFLGFETECICLRLKVLPGHFYAFHYHGQIDFNISQAFRVQLTYLQNGTINCFFLKKGQQEPKHSF